MERCASRPTTGFSRRSSLTENVRCYSAQAAARSKSLDSLVLIVEGASMVKLGATQAAPPQVALDGQLRVTSIIAIAPPEAWVSPFLGRRSDAECDACSTHRPGWMFSDWVPSQSETQYLEGILRGIREP